MSVFDIGRLCVKIAGRDAGKKCVVVECVDDHFVVVDGQTRRRKVNVKHLEPLGTVLEISGQADHGQVAKAFESLGIKVRTTKPKNAPKPLSQSPNTKDKSIEAATKPAKAGKKKEAKA